MDVNYVLVGRRIKYFRIQKNITQEELAFEINTSPAYISNIERGKKKPSLQKLFEISDILGVTINDLVYSSSKNTAFLNNKELSELLSLCTPDKQQLVINSISSIIQSFIT